MNNPNVEKVYDDWMDKWEQALFLWSRYIRLKEPTLCRTKKEENQNGLSQSFAMIRLNDLSVVISLPKIIHLKLERFPVEVMAHEIGHHIYCPADLTDLAKMAARIRRALPSKENMTSFVGNLYSDLLVNDRLFREQGLRMDRIYRALEEKTDNKLWNFYLRIYEILWSLKKGTLTSIAMTDEMEADAQLGNRIIRHYSKDWLSGAGRFASLCLTYILEDENGLSSSKMNELMDTGSAGEGSEFPDGLTAIDTDEIEGSVHPSYEGDDFQKNENTESKGNYREPFEYGQILKSIGINMTGQDIAMRYYRERAIPYIIPFPVERIPQSSDPLPEGLETWDIGTPLDKINWVESIIRSPVVIPGVTTMQRVYGKTQGSEPRKEPIDLDLYVDCSGSMPNPIHNISYLTLAASIISISALRAGSRVQATLWSGTDQFSTTDGFVRNEKEIMKIMTGYYGDGTAFPIHLLRETYTNRKASSRKVHILVISDEGVTTMFENDEKGNSGYDIAKNALEKAGGGGTFVLNLYSGYDDKELDKAKRMGWNIFRINNWSDLVKFSKEFSKKHYQEI